MICGLGRLAGKELELCYCAMDVWYQTRLSDC